MPTVLITGGTGLIGTALTKLLLEKEYAVIIVSRGIVAKEHRLPGNIQYAQWDIQQQTIDAGAIQQADYIVHLAGAAVADKRWNTNRKKEIQDSRTKSSSLIVKALTEIPNKVKAVISASGIGWYGPDPVIPNTKPFIETDAAATDFLGTTCLLWEESIDPVTALGKRLVKIRTGIVLANEGGALPEFKRPLRFGIAAILGSGKQVVSWIHIDDLCRIFTDAIEKQQLQGVYNAITAHPVNNRTLTIELAKRVRGKFFIPVYVPAFVLKVALGEMSIEVLKSATVSAGKIRATGFAFIYPTLEAALQALIKDNEPRKKG